MNTKRLPITASLALCALLLSLLAGQAPASGQALPADVAASSVGTAFTYQGQLKSDGTPYTGACDFQFALWDALSGGSQIGTTQNKTNVNVADGFFALQLDFGAGAFQGDARWLAMSVRCPAGAGDYTPLIPRQPLTPAPYALYAAGSWRTTGNAGTTPGVNYLGTSDNVALELKVNGARVLRLEPNATSPNLIGGYSGNWITNGVYGVTIAGGGLTGFPNFVTDAYGTVGGGSENQAGDNAGTVDDAQYATIAGGRQNLASAELATVAGGWGNFATGSGAFIGGGGDHRASGDTATVGGGYANQATAKDATVGGGDHNTASAEGATVAGGWSNTASGERSAVSGGDNNIASGNDSTVGGGNSNIAGDYCATVGGGEGNTAIDGHTTIGGGLQNTTSQDGATVGGGYSNTASGERSTVSGGENNTASSWYATVPGGQDNLAQGAASFAAGTGAKAYNNGCFVWADFFIDNDLICDVDNRWVARASGGVYFYTNSTLSSGVYVAAGGNSWNGVSDRAVKENFSPADGQAILDTLASLPIHEYNLKSQDPSIRHIGPVAQDFSAFGYGESDTAINMQDADGVALASIQALYGQVQALQAENADLEARLAALEAAAGSSGGSARPWQWGLLPGLGLLACGLVWVARRGGDR